MNKVVILGAGSTIGTFNGASLGVDRFVERLYYVRGGEWRLEYPCLAEVIGDCEAARGRTPSLDRVWTRIDYYAKLSCALSRAPYDASRELHCALLDAYSLTDHERAALESGAEFTLKTILRSLASGDVLISFNWDTAAEYVARGVKLDLVAGPADGSKAGVRLIKPHGSLSWRHGAASPGSKVCDVLWNNSGAPRLEPMRRSDVVPNDGGPGAHFCEPLVLGAVPIKSELLWEIQERNHPCVHNTIVGQWREAVRAIRHASELVVAGYGFPSEDSYGHFLFREAVRQRQECLPIAYYSLPQDRGKVEASLREVFGACAKYTFEGPVNPAALADTSSEHCRQGVDLDKADASHRRW